MQQTLVSQIAPQRSTQYTALATNLAPSELKLSLFGRQIASITPCTLGEQAYLRIELDTPLSEEELFRLGTLAMTSAYFIHYDRIGDVEGPFLSPINTGFVPEQPVELITARRYRGKTNELFTQWLCNIAKFSSTFAKQPWSDLTILDPLSGGGTTLFVGLVIGAETVAGIDEDNKESKAAATFLHRFAQEQRISARLKEERLKKLGQRWTVSIERAKASIATERLSKAQREANRQTAIFAGGDTAEARDLLPGFKPHLIVADLPYGIQHQGGLTNLLEKSLPGWSSMLRQGGVMALAWDSTRFPKAKMQALVEESTELTILEDPPYNELCHQVDRVIKERNVLIARL